MTHEDLIITNHAIERYQERIAYVSREDAVVAIRIGIAAAKDKHLEPHRLAKRTFYIPTGEMTLIGSNNRIVTVLRSSGD
jgi:hypothetical protein